MFGLHAEQVHTAGTILEELTRNWRDLVAGSEGYLTDKCRRSFHRLARIYGNI